ncbi:MAG: recombination regulator RecX [Betaproteobacteria bacterium]|jgi:regulatory protein|nr:recombination regulator RecX [Betaproteobacteria bacterium]NBY18265.1 recombination regulator RecX [Betaproteobacteria bacterium]
MAFTLSLRARALRFLALREHSRLELSRKLRRYVAEAEAETPEVLDRLLDDLERDGWLSEQRFAEQWVASRSSRFGDARIRQELRARGIEADKALPHLKANGLEDSEHARAFELWRRRYGGEAAADLNERARQARFLMQRGFSGEVVSRIVRGQAPR